MTALLWGTLLTTALVAVVALGLVLALAGRVRVLAGRLDEQTDPFGDALPRAGDPVPDFRITATNGTSVATTDLADDGEMLLAFLTTDCGSCREVARAMAAEDPPAHRSVAFVIGPAEQRRAMVADLEPSMPVVELPDHGGIVARFGVRAFPAVLRAGRGTILAAGHQLADVRA
jgi:hypothetical protein